VVVPAQGVVFALDMLAWEVIYGFEAAEGNLQQKKANQPDLSVEKPNSQPTV
jgi:hypothetical protein